MLLLYSIPETWRKPVCLKRRDELIIIAQRAIDFIENYRSKFTIKWCQRRNFLSAIAIRDKLIESRRYIDTEPFSGSGDDSLYDHLMLAQSRVYRYYAYEIDWYRNQPVKDWAEHIESDDSTKTIIKADVYKIRISDTDHHLHLTPSGVPSLVGGVFAPGLKKGGAFVSSVRTVLFMTLSSYLAEMTGERKYTDIATLGANCIKTWMMDSTTRLIKDCLIDAQTAQERSGAELSCHLTGVVIEGLTVLASVSGEDSWRMLAIEIARAAMCYEPWHSSDGILTLSKDRATSENTNNKTFKGLLNRGLLVAYERNRLNEPFCNMVRCYINVQFNALYELSRIQNAYGMDWRGPYAGPYAHAQIAAFDTIVAALGVSEG
ncbi:hypothetical protein FRC03_004567 [Tulasnella sp. 419]|nr:hypothetical protein FRC03_004567 [Tulasnella sp. 419]